jgi:hypothetical protein
LLLIFGLHINKKIKKNKNKKYKKIYIGRKSKKYISEKSIPEYPENY